ncbi:MAG TPA: pseudaminic acid cytidylyltransferase [Burkholderiales bacterium]|nr:pseudaminic acid cytidylyltransferase [Burkholderiales bacterium]
MKVAVIPARGGSKRIPRKNIREFAGKPMIAHAIECALGSGLFGRVVVSTDDAEIAAVARAHGAETPFVRPAQLADDHAGTTDVIAHATQWLLDSGVELSAVCCIYATAPFTRGHDLERALAMLESGRWHYVFAATTYAFPIFRSLQRDTGGGVRMFFPQHFATRSQDLPEALHDAGQFYWGRPQAWLNRETIFDTHSAVLMIERWRVQDIDTPEDWERAQVLWRLMQASPETAH